MATARPFAYNTGSLIPGTEQLGDLSIGFPSSGFTDAPQFWNGPDEELGYVIAQPVPLGNQPNPVGIPAYVGFFRSESLTDSSFLELSESIAGQTFPNVYDAYTWLNNNGYWTSFVPPAVTPTPTPTLTQTPTNTSTSTPTPTPSITASQTATPTTTTTPTPSITASQTATPTPSVTPTQTPTNTNTPTPSITASQTVTPTITQTPTNTRTPNVTPTPTITQTPTKTTTPTPTRPVSYTYYRWQITQAKETPPNSDCVQAAEFVFQVGGVDQSMAGVTVTNPNGNNPAGETPPNLVDNNLTTKALDLNFVANGLTNFIFQFGSAKSFNGYRWATANDEESRDPKSWTIAGSNNGTTWTTLSTVSNFTATVARDTWQTAQTY